MEDNKFSLSSKIHTNYYKNSKLLRKYPNIHNVYVWDDSAKLFISLLNHRALHYNYSKYRDGFHLSGKQLKVGYGINAPFIYEKNNQLYGFLYDIWQIAEEIYNFTSIYFELHSRHAGRVDALLNIYSPARRTMHLDHSQALNTDGSSHKKLSYRNPGEIDAILNNFKPTHIAKYVDFSQGLNKDGSIYEEFRYDIDDALTEFDALIDAFSAINTPDYIDFSQGLNKDGSTYYELHSNQADEIDALLNAYKPTRRRQHLDQSVGVNTDGSIYTNNKSHESDVWLNIYAPTQSHMFRDYSQALNKDGYSLFMKKPKREIEEYAYLRTFSKEMWLYGFGCLIFIYICLVITLKLLPSQYKDSSFSLCMLSVLSGICNQGTEMRLSALSSRGVLLMALIFGYLIYTAFAAVLMSNLAVDLVEFPITTIEDVHRLKTYSMCVRTKSVLYTHEVFTKLTDETNEEYELLPQWNGIVNGPLCIDINNHEKIAEIICKDNVVIFELVSVMTQLRMYTENIPCTYYKVSKEYFPLPNQIVYGKYWPYGRHINILINRIRSSGILTRLVKYWLKHHSDDNNDIEQQTYTKIGLARILSIFKSYMFIFIICIFILFIEILIFKINQSKENRIKNNIKYQNYIG